VLDEAHNIKNFQSQRWQTLVNFNTQRRLLLTGTPLQNNLMELWSLLHFLMPYIFRSRKEFSYWFSNPMNNIIEGNTNRNDDLISRLHAIIRPFILRRLKKEVETQMPGKFEHIVQCQLSRRQMFLYEEYMGRSSTRTALKKGGNYMGMMSVLMQLRKVCNHPDLFEPRSVVTPFFSECLNITAPLCVININKHDCVHQKLSPHLIHPLWSMGVGIPSFDVTMKNDSIIASELHKLQTPSPTIRKSLHDRDVREPKPTKGLKSGLMRHLDRIWNKAKIEEEEKKRFHSQINSLRCDGRTSSFPQSLVDTLTIDLCLQRKTVKSKKVDVIRISETPDELLKMIKTQQERADDLEDLIKKFVFCVPKAGSRSPVLTGAKYSHKNCDVNERYLSSALSRSFEAYFKPFKEVQSRLTSFFPDKKLIQFDAGKLQTLAGLLGKLKQSNHRVLIFTQMSKMLDIFEVFLNLNGHTYLRLDGSIGVEQRQRLMDRFNNDPKVFCFILSTRSGGLGINLTGADTVIFYDSDWNPAMDAQAQDRAHRIGQTRDVHIYRLVTEHTIEENILIKAKQKRHLDFLVMDEGKFNATPPASNGKEDNSQESNVFTESGLRNILGLGGDAEEKTKVKEDTKDAEKEKNMSKEQIETTMASLEDEDDVRAMQGAQKEAAEELEEFDETIQLKGDGDENEDDSQEENDNQDKKKKEKKHKAKGESSVQDNVESVADEKDEELEKEFAAWQSKFGVDKASIDASLIPIERFALKFREVHDPFYSMWCLSEKQRMQEAQVIEDEWDIEAIEVTKAEEERRAIEDGDLLATRPQPKDLLRQRQLYFREKSRLRSNKKRRKLTGENWSTKIDGKTKHPFWYNDDTGEAVWDKPKVLIELYAEEIAHKERWNAIPMKPLLLVMEYLVPFPERMQSAYVCRQWRRAAHDISFVKHVFPVEMGALAMNRSKMERNHFRTVEEALSESLPGDTIELGDGHYWLNNPKIVIDFPLRIVGDEKDPSHVILELCGTIVWACAKGWLEGLTFRRPKITNQLKKDDKLLDLKGNCKVHMENCVINGHSNANMPIL